nr:hypothetical protein [Tanacetum cinerariifolium]
MGWRGHRVVARQGGEWMAGVEVAGAGIRVGLAGAGAATGGGGGGARVKGQGQMVAWQGERRQGWVARGWWHGRCVGVGAGVATGGGGGVRAVGRSRGPPWAVRGVVAARRSPWRLAVVVGVVHGGGSGRSCPGGRLGVAVMAGWRWGGSQWRWG